MNFAEDKNGESGEEEVGYYGYDCSIQVLNNEIRGSSRTSLGYDDSFELTFGETFAGHLIIPRLVQVWPALQYPQEAQNDIAHDEDGYGCL